MKGKTHVKLKDKYKSFFGLYFSSVPTVPPSDKLI